MTKQPRDPIVLSGRVHLIGGLADERPSLELRGSATAGDIKLWSHLKQGRGNTGGQGQFRAAIFDGKKWRTFRLNFVSGDHARYDSFDERRRKLSDVLRSVYDLKGKSAYFKEGSFGVLSTIKVDVPAFAARQAETSRTATLPAAGRGEVQKAERQVPVQLKLF